VHDQNNHLKPAFKGLPRVPLPSIAGYKSPCPGLSADLNPSLPNNTPRQVFPRCDREAETTVDLDTLIVQATWVEDNTLHEGHLGRGIVAALTAPHQLHAHAWGQSVQPSGAGRASMRDLRDVNDLLSDLQSLPHLHFWDLMILDRILGHGNFDSDLDKIWHDTYFPCVAVSAA
jgi:hypothetical protein